MRALSDSEFRARLRDAPDEALARWDLTPDERQAVTSGDLDQLLDFGVDKRLVQIMPPGIFRD
jgi:hypothetical protein